MKICSEEEGFYSDELIRSGSVSGRMQFFGGSGDANPSPLAPAGTGSPHLGNNTFVMYVFNRNGECLLYREWHRPLRTLDSNQDQKLMFGLLFSLKSFTAKMDPTRYFNFRGQNLIFRFMCCCNFSASVSKKGVLECLYFRVKAALFIASAPTLTS